MAVKQISGLTPVVFLSPSAQLEILQDGTTYRASADQIAGLATKFSLFKVENDVADSTPWYPTFIKVTSGSTDTVYTSDPNYNYIPLEGRLSALRHESTQGIHLNANTISLSYTVPAGTNGLSSGPVTVTAPAVITVNTGSSWVVV